MVAWSGDDIAGLRIANVTDDEMAEIRSVMSKWNARIGKNAKRSLYYDTEQSFRDLGIALPPQLKRAKTVLGWAMQAVRKPAMRTQFEGLRLPGSSDPLELGEVLARNSFALEFGQAVVAAYTHGLSLIHI